MIIQRKTIVLFVIALLLLGLNFLSEEGLAPLPNKLPQIPAMTKDQITRIELTSMGEKVALERDSNGWRILSPITARADQARINALLLNFRKPISMDIAVDEQNSDKYGLDSNNGIIVDVWTEGISPKASFTIGFDAKQGGSFIRLSGDESVYRASMGGRHRYKHTATDWINQVLLDFSENEIQSITVNPSNRAPYQLIKNPQWTISPAPSWKISGDEIKKKVQQLGRLRIGKRDKEPLSRIDLEMVIRKKDGVIQNLKAELAEQAFVQIDDLPERFVLSSQLLTQLVADQEVFRDKRILSFQWQSALDLLQYQDAEQTILIQHDLSNHSWQVIKPLLIDLDMGKVYRMLHQLAVLQAESFPDEVDDVTMLGDVEFQLQLKMLDGTQLEINFWPGDLGVYYSKISTDPRVFLVSSDFVASVKSAFSIGN